jgi:hypothetical protein
MMSYVSKSQRVAIVQTSDLECKTLQLAQEFHLVS